MAMGQYRKKPVVIEAQQIKDSDFDNPHPNPDLIQHITYNPVTREVYIQTLEGTMTGVVGDWIIKGVKGELYPCKPDIFEATYDKVENAETIDPAQVGRSLRSNWTLPRSVRGDGGRWSMDIRWVKFHRLPDGVIDYTGTEDRILYDCAFEEATHGIVAKADLPAPVAAPPVDPAQDRIPEMEVFFEDKKCAICGGTGHYQEQNERGEFLFATGGMPIILDCKCLDSGD